jgi:HmuY protein
MMRAAPFISLSLILWAAACGDNADPLDQGPDAALIDAPVDAPPTGACNPAAVLPLLYRPLPKVAATNVNFTTTDGVTSGTIDATAGGFMMAADNPYIYVDLKNGVKVAINDIEARTSTTWDIAIKRSSPRLNGGDTGAGGRTSVAVPATTLAEVTAGPAAGYQADDFTTEDCKMVSLPAGEPMSAFGEWYEYAMPGSVVTPKPEVHVIQRPDGSRTALRIVAYYQETPRVSAIYTVQFKQLPPAAAAQ